MHSKHSSPSSPVENPGSVREPGIRDENPPEAPVSERPRLAIVFAATAQRGPGAITGDDLEFEGIMGREALRRVYG